MAAGRHGGYRDNGFRDRESSFDVSRRGYTNSDEDCDRIRTRSRDGVRGGNTDARDRIRVRQKDTREREAMDGSYHSSSSRSDSGSSSSGRGPRKCGFSAKATDREPGELSSDSGSDEAIESEPQGKGFEVAKVEKNGTQSPLGRKRKFSPIVWDQDDKEVNGSSKLKVPTTVTTLPPPPPLPKSFRQSPDTPYGGVEIHPVSNRETESDELPPAVKPSLSSESLQDVDTESTVRALPSSPDQNLGNELQAEQLEGDDDVPMHNISSSRWAAGDNSPGDEGEIIDDYEGARAKSSESEERVSHGKISTGDDHAAIGSSKDDYMEIDGQCVKSETTVSHSDTASEDETESDELNS